MPRNWIDLTKNGGTPAKAPKGFFERKEKEKACGAKSKRKRAYSLVGRSKLRGPAVGYTSPDEFYKSREWRELRIAALAHCKFCQACGRRPPETVLHVDHIKPRYKYPELSLDPQNIQVLCEDCNIGKGAWLEADFR